ncbi:hypothetical protein DFP72DRAFT_1077153 [Ephemerocybe angulata]|uniref:Uncharacterized protein n=1 Tax=Ephemerocybe angulata TaxID=980116 RepID=A0A8H6HF60_9AGAR|nr:hypothetical protein DFP72DRAFT_1077153 [Tulosesus angulatus]
MLTQVPTCPIAKAKWLEEQWERVLQDYELSESDDKPDPKFEAEMEAWRNRPPPKPQPPRYVEIDSEIDDIPVARQSKPKKPSAAETRVRRTPRAATAAASENQRSTTREAIIYCGSSSEDSEAEPVMRPRRGQPSQAADKKPQPSQHTAS